MGICGDIKKEEALTLPSFFKDSQNNEINIPLKSDFFHFSEWMIKFRYYIKLKNDNIQLIRLITRKLGPNEKNIFKIIKALDQLKGKELHEYTLNYISLSSKSNNINNNINKTNINHHNNYSHIINHKNNINNLKKSDNSKNGNDDLRINLSILFDKLCYHKMKKINKLLLLGPPNNLRWLIWFSKAKSKYFEIESKIGINNSQIYNNIINLNINKEIEKKINEDLNKTFPKIKYFTNLNLLNSLFNLLKAYSIYDKEIGYITGMNKIAANILIVSDFNEIESFLVLRFFFSDNYGLSFRNFFKENSQKLKFYSFLIIELIKERLLSIYEIITKFQIEKELCLDKWIISLFNIFFDFCITIRLYDCLISLGENFLINFTLGFIKYYQNIILNFKDKNSFFKFFEKKFKFKNDKEILSYRERIIILALEFNISQITIKRIEKKYNQEMKLKNEFDKVYHNFTIKNKIDNNYEVDIMKFIRKTYYKEDYNIIENEFKENIIINNISKSSNNINKRNKNNDEITINEDNDFITTNKKQILKEESLIKNIFDNFEEKDNLNNLFPLLNFDDINFEIDKENNTYNKNMIRKKKNENEEK